MRFASFPFKNKIYIGLKRYTFLFLFVFCSSFASLADNKPEFELFIQAVLQKHNIAVQLGRTPLSYSYGDHLKHSPRKAPVRSVFSNIEALYDIFSYLPDYQKSGWIGSTKVSGENPVLHLYIKPLTQVGPEDKRKRLGLLLDSVFNSHIKSRQIKRLNMYFSYPVVLKNEALLEFYDFFSGIYLLMKSFSPEFKKNILGGLNYNLQLVLDIMYISDGSSEEAPHLSDLGDLFSSFNEKALSRQGKVTIVTHKRIYEESADNKKCIAMAGKHFSKLLGQHDEYNDEASYVGPTVFSEKDRGARVYFEVPFPVSELNMPSFSDLFSLVPPDHIPTAVSAGPLLSGASTAQLDEPLWHIRYGDIIDEKDQQYLIQKGKILLEKLYSGSSEELLDKEMLSKFKELASLRNVFFDPSIPHKVEEKPEWGEIYRQTYLANIVSLMWYINFLADYSKEEMNKRASFTLIDPAHKIYAFLLEYIKFTTGSPNPKDLPYFLTSNNFGYRRDPQSGGSSHHKKISPEAQFGIDLRMTKESTVLKLLPYGHTHILFGNLDMREAIDLTFLKFEPVGLGALREITAHGKNFAESLSATKTPKRVEHKMHPRVERALKPLRSIIDLEGKAWTIGNIYRNLKMIQGSNDISPHKQKIDAFLSLLDEIYPMGNHRLRVGNEIILDMKDLIKISIKPDDLLRMAALSTPKDVLSLGVEKEVDGQEAGFEDWFEVTYGINEDEV